MDWAAKTASGPPPSGWLAASIEMICTAANRYDIARLGWRPSGPRPARPTLYIIAVRVCKNMMRHPAGPMIR